MAVIGIPYDGTTTYRPGARFGPKEIRYHSALVKTYNQFLNVDVFHSLNVIDYGGVNIDPMSIDRTYESIEREVAKIIGARAFPICVGGDHSISLPVIRALSKKPGPLSMIHFDAHTGTWGDFFGHPYFHGSPFRRAIEEGILEGSSIWQIGLRGGLKDEDDYCFARDQGAHIIAIDQFKNRGTASVCKDFSVLKGKKIYVSLDIDVVDPAFAPGTGFPEVGGMTSHEIITMIRSLVELDIVGFDLVEVLPAYDQANITSLLAGHLLFEFLSVLALKCKGD